MTCTTCKATVQVNATGTCLGCQQGFNKFMKDDHYKEVDHNLKRKTKPTEAEKLLERDNCGIIPQKEENNIARLVERQKELQESLKPTSKPVVKRKAKRKYVRKAIIKEK